MHVLSSSKSLGLSSAGPSETSDVQTYCEALIQHADMDEACAARQVIYARRLSFLILLPRTSNLFVHQVESEQELADATTSVIVGNLQQVSNADLLLVFST